MAIHLYGNENQVIKYLKLNNLSDSEARIYTAILCRQYRSPLNELVSLLKYHLPGLSPSPKSMENEINAAIEVLIKLGLLTKINKLQDSPIEANSPWEKVLEMNLLQGSPVKAEIVEIVNGSLKNYADYSQHERNLIERLGWATWEAPRDGFRDAIKQAKQLIRMGVYSSITVYDEIKDDIKDAWINHKEMEVHILMFSPKLAAKLEKNPDLARDVQIRTKDWKHLYSNARKEAWKFGNNPKLKIRHLQDERMAAFHRVLLVDDQRWMLNVHRPGIERGIEGIVYQGSSNDSGPSNLYTLLDHYWYAAWESGVDPSLPNKFLFVIRHYSHIFVLVALLFLAWYVYHYGADWWGIKNDWWGGAIVGLIIAEIYNNGVKILQTLLEPLKWLVVAAQSFFVLKR